MIIMLKLNNFVNHVSRLSMTPASFARKTHCLHICLHNEVSALSNIYIYLIFITFLCIYQS